MKLAQGPSPSAVELPLRSTTEPTLLLRLEPWHRVFLGNLADVVWRKRPPELELSSEPAFFWPDVFVASRLPWSKFAGSVLCHVAVLAGVWGLARFWPQQRPAVVQRTEFSREDVVFYSPQEYLAPLNTGESPTPISQAGDPEYAPQEIISVPPESDNRRQTIVTPPDVELHQDQALPNIVEWSKADPAVPLEATARPVGEEKLPALPVAVVKPVPEVNGDFSRSAALLPQPVVAPAPEINVTASTNLQAPQPAIVAPPPTVDAASVRSWGDLNIGHSMVVAPASALPLGEQRASVVRARATLGSGGAVVPPPPSISGGSASGGAGRLIALGIHPAALRAPLEPPAGNRRGTFAAGPGGKSGAAGTPALAGTLNQTDGSGAQGSDNLRGVPRGLIVGAAPGHAATSSSDGMAKGKGGGHGVDAAQDSQDPPLTASVTPPRVGGTSGSAASAVSDNKTTDLDRMVFGARKFYSMTLNMPNLNSAGGSWIIRFAELKQDETKGELTAPVATQKVDPAYPIELMRHNVQGTVTLYAIIRGDGSVAEVRVLRGVDDRLDEYARAALARWRFQPATRNGSAVDLEAVVMIPFRAVRVKSSF